MAAQHAPSGANEKANNEAERELAALREIVERYELALQGASDGIWDWNVATGEVYFSPRWKQMIGYDEHEFPNNFDAWQEHLHPDDRASALEIVQSYLDGRLPVYELEHRLRCKDGTYRWILARGVGLPGPDGRPVRMAGSHTDITRRKAAENALRTSASAVRTAHEASQALLVELKNNEALYQSLVENLPLSIFRKDLQGRFTFANARCCRTLGRALDEIKGKTDADLFAPDLAEKYRRDDERVMATGETFEDIEEHRAPGSQATQFVHVLKTPVRDARGALTGTQAIFWDVTAREQAAQAMQRAKEAAEAATRAKSEFLANMSHEIRTPMNGILGMTELALDTPLSPEQREYLTLAKNSADDLLRLLNDILDFSKIEAGRLDLDPHPFALRDRLGDTVATLAHRAHAKSLELACHVRPNVPDALVGDAGRLRQIIVNLLGNAIKFTERGEVVVEVDVAAEPAAAADDNVWLRFVVRDTGIGIAPDKQQAIFEAFSQADMSTTRRYGGTGLGLAIASQLVALMGGVIGVESTPGRGSAFSFTARFGLAPAPVASADPPRSLSLQNLPVLVVDDNETNRRILGETLTNWGMKPTVVDGAPAALAVLEFARGHGEPFALVLLDAMMPGTDGFMLAGQIQSRPDLAAPTLMMLSSGDRQGDAARCRELGVSTYLAKPVKQSDLLDAVMNALAAAEPAAPADAARPAPPVFSSEPPQPLPTTRPLRVLLAEDNAVNQRLAVRTLEKRGHTVVVAANGRQALAALERGRADGLPFDLVLMDIQMPEMDGFEATAAIRDREKETDEPRLPIIAMTAHAMKGDRERCLAAGMDGYVAKPLQPGDLFAVVAGVLGGIAAPRPEAAAAPPPPPTPSAEPCFDRAAALRRTGNDEELLNEIIALFLADAPDLLAQIKSALTQNDARALERAAHTLKSAAATLSAAPVQQLARDLETHGRENNLSAVSQLLARLEAELARLEPALRPREMA